MLLEKKELVIFVATLEYVRKVKFSREFSHYKWNKVDLFLLCQFELISFTDFWYTDKLYEILEKKEQRNLRIFSFNAFISSRRLNNI